MLHGNWDKLRLNGVIGLCTDLALRVPGMWLVESIATIAPRKKRGYDGVANALILLVIKITAPTPTCVHPYLGMHTFL